MVVDHIALAVLTTGVRARALIDVERRRVVVQLREQLGVDVASRELWDGADAPEGKFRPDGWELIPKYVGTSSCLMFLDGVERIWKFKNGSDLRKVLNECPALEFYVCDRVPTYLLCHNHHDYVIGWGAARQWVDRLGKA